MRLVITVTLVFLAACSALFSVRVGPFDVPIANNLGNICWIQVDATNAPRVRTATYRAQATYNPGALGLGEQVVVQFFGRSVDPVTGCTDRDDATDLPLSNVFELKRETSQPVVIGGAAYGPSFGELVNSGVFWLGATATDNVGVGEQLHFGEGRVTVGF